MYQRTSLEFLFDFRFSSRKPQSQQKLAKKIAHFIIQFRSKNILHFTNLDSLHIENNMLSHNTDKNRSDFKIFADMFLLGVRENIYTEPFLDAQELHFWSILKANVYLWKNFFSQRRSNILSDEGGLGEGWMIPQDDSLFGSRKIFNNFSFWLKYFKIFDWHLLAFWHFHI